MAVSHVALDNYKRAVLFMGHFITPFVIVITLNQKLHVLFLFVTMATGVLTFVSFCVACAFKVTSDLFGFN